MTSLVQRYEVSFSQANNRLLIWLALLVVGLLAGEFFTTPILVGFLYILDVVLGAHRKRFHLLHLILLYFLILFLQKKLLIFGVVLFMFSTDVAFSLFVRKVFKRIYHFIPLGFELVFFNTFIMGYAFGPLSGLLCGLLFGTTYYSIMFKMRSRYQLITIPFYGFMGYLAGTFSHLPVFSLGMTLAAIYAIFTSTLIYLIFKGKAHKCLAFAITNILFNYWLFSHASFLLLRILG